MLSLSYTGCSSSNQDAAIIEEMRGITISEGKQKVDGEKPVISKVSKAPKRSVLVLIEFDVF